MVGGVGLMGISGCKRPEESGKDIFKISGGLTAAEGFPLEWRDEPQSPFPLSSAAACLFPGIAGVVGFPPCAECQCGGWDVVEIW